MRGRVALLAALAALPLAVALACAIGQEPVAFGDAARALLGLDVDADTRLIVLDLRLPRVALAAAVGAALALAGAALQGLFQNPLADPYVLGISAGGALGAALVLVFGAAGLVAAPAGAFVGAAAAALLVWRLAQVGASCPWRACPSRASPSA
ncbi:MAG: iron chelate uptake ABC transporter family permease subunit [bacterium]